MMAGVPVLALELAGVTAAAAAAAAVAALCFIYASINVSLSPSLWLGHFNFTDGFFDDFTFPFISFLLHSSSVFWQQLHILGALIAALGRRDSRQDVSSLGTGS